jgi:NAD(P)H-dependent FMN reductase
MTDTPIRLALLIGSTRRACTSRTVADWFTGQVADRADLEPTVLDLADFPLTTAGPSWQPEPSEQDTLARSRPLLTAADAFVVVTPEYNRSFPAGLKNFIDWHLTEWQAKPVALVSHGGGMSAGLRAVEQLRLVFAELRAVTIRDTVSFQGGIDAFDGQGRPVDAAGAAAAAKTMLDDLTWWALALRDGRAARPYAA